MLLGCLFNCLGRIKIKVFPRSYITQLVGQQPCFSYDKIGRVVVVVAINPGIGALRFNQIVQFSGEGLIQNIALVLRRVIQEGGYVVRHDDGFAGSFIRQFGSDKN